MSFTHFFSVSVVAVDCWPPISFRVTRIIVVNDLDGAVERRASGGGVAEVEDAGNATACLGEDEVRCV